MKISYGSGLLMGLLLLLGCAEKKDPQAAIATANLKKATAMFEAFNQHDWNKMASFYAADAKFLDPSYGMDWVRKNKADLMANYAAMQKASPDIKDQISAIFAADDKVSIQFASSGTTKGHQWTLPISTILTFKDGKIINDATYYDK